MTKPGYFKSKGKISFTLPSEKVSFCLPRKCCSFIPDQLKFLWQLEEGISGPLSGGGGTVLHCDMTTLMKVPGTFTWTGSIVAPNCLEPNPTLVVFSCDDSREPVNATSCIQMFSLTINGVILSDEYSCCCFDVDEDNPNEMRGEVCFVGGLGTLWTGSRANPSTGCENGPWINENDASISIAWVFIEPAYYDEVCCQPPFCPDETWCPSNPCVEVMMAAMSRQPREIPESLQKWLLLEEESDSLETSSTIGGEDETIARSKDVDARNFTRNSTLYLPK